jgi:hypothetical protein
MLVYIRAAGYYVKSKNKKKQLRLVEGGVYIQVGGSSFFLEIERAKYKKIFIVFTFRNSGHQGKRENSSRDQKNKNVGFFFA